MCHALFRDTRVRKILLEMVHGQPNFSISCAESGDSILQGHTVQLSEDIVEDNRVNWKHNFGMCMHV